MIDLVSNIDMLAAKLAQIAFLIVAAKYITKRTGAKKLDLFLMKIHRPAGYVLLGAGIVHTVLSFRNIATTPIAVYVLGITCILAVAAAITTFLFRKKLGKNWRLWHNTATVVALVTLIVHPMLSKGGWQ